ncbi:MAG TPA: hypothetical protein VFG49_08790 [Dyella sp.]|uniref:hypothetical protein n=1 Tax=Dyella sp. TaxID=1869338 RepID=UPI002D79624F|nr:hypothetical protein [Dyella sp.]HET6553620.1 hypothetical protein [Dyella sp.]
MNTQIKLAVASVLAMGASNAFAISTSAIHDAFTAGTLVTLYVSGATSTDGTFENLAKLNSGGYCKPGTLDTYYYKSSSGSVVERAMACLAPALTDTVTSATIADGTPVIVLKESHGGSANGIVYVARGLGTQFMDITNTSNFGTVCASVTTTVTSTTAFAAYNTHDCGYDSATSIASTVSSASVVPNGGVSDVDPATFVGTSSVTASDATSLGSVRRTVAVGFNPAVSLPLYLALQKAEGLVATSATVPDDSSVDKMPSLPASVVREILTGTLTDASNIYVGPPNAAGTTATQLSTVLQSAGAFTTPSTSVYLCRRGNSSGSEYAIGAMFLNQGCGKNTSSIQAIKGATVASCTASGCSWSFATYGANPVFAGSGSGDVRSCLGGHGSNDQLAMGVLSLEAKPAVAGGSLLTDTYRYVKVDWQAPTLKSTIEGNYSYFVENTFNDVALTSAGTSQSTLWNTIYSAVGNPTSIIATNSSWKDAAAVGSTGSGEADVGILDLPASGHLPTLPVTAASVRTNPINGLTKLKSGSGTANDCNMGTQAY